MDGCNLCNFFFYFFALKHFPLKQKGRVGEGWAGGGEPMSISYKF